MLISGGAGFIGSSYVRRRLTAATDPVVVLDKLTYAGFRGNLPTSDEAPLLEFVQGDIVDRELVRELFRKHRPAAVVNFAAESHVDRSIDAPGTFVDTNIRGTFELLEGARAHWDSLEGADRERFRFLHVSTDEVFGSLGPDGAFREDTPYAPNSPYAASKAAADHLVRAYHRTYGLPTLITNSSNNYGPRQFPEKLIPLMILNAVEGKPLPIYGDGRNVRDWIYVVDHCQGIDRVLEQGRIGESYNIGGHAERTNIEVVDTLCRVLERLRPAQHNPALADRAAGYAGLKTFVADRKGHDRRYAIDSGKMRRELGWSPEYDFERGLEATVRWYLEHRDWCAEVQKHGRYDRGRLGLGETSAGPDSAPPRKQP